MKLKCIGSFPLILLKGYNFRFDIQAVKELKLDVKSMLFLDREVNQISLNRKEHQKSCNLHSHSTKEKTEVDIGK